MYIIFLLHLDPLKRYKCLVAFGGQSPTINCYLCNGLESRNDSYIFGISTHDLLVKFSIRALAHELSGQSALPLSKIRQIISPQRIKMKKSLMARFLARKMVYLHTKNQLSSSIRWSARAVARISVCRKLPNITAPQLFKLES